jgi:hypothetical protein
MVGDKFGTQVFLLVLRCPKAVPRVTLRHNHPTPVQIRLKVPFNWLSLWRLLCPARSSCCGHGSVTVTWQ